MAAVFAALGDDTRLAIISKLQDGSDCSLSMLAEGFSLTRQGVSRHMQVLEKARLVRRRRIGRETKYQLEVDALSRARDYLAHATSQWDNAIERLARHLES